MQIVTTAAAMRAACREIRRAGKTLGFVPTMGALHAGHISLVHAALDQCDAVAASIFVNPTQFGPNEDYANYPRTFEQDCALLKAEGVVLVFAPPPEEMYPPGATTYVEVAAVGDRLDGVSRPGHFRGVATIVAKLFHIVSPQKAFFGQKDAAQVAVLRSMVRDLNFDLELVACPTVREADGLAMSSRNRYLSAEDRARALVLSRALLAVEAAFRAGEAEPSRLVEAGRNVVAMEGIVQLEYLEIVHPDSLVPVAHAHAGALVAIAARVGSTRLIDNVLL